MQKKNIFSKNRIDDNAGITTNVIPNPTSRFRSDVPCALHPADILLPSAQVDFGKWAVIACDQFTSQLDYWQRVERCVQDAPSMLRLIYPEIYLQGDDETAYRERIARIQGEMKRYQQEGILREAVRKGYVMTVRKTEAGERIGLVAALDLEQYDFDPESGSRVRATEATVRERIPVRVGIRQGAPLESPHVMLLLDDPEGRLLECLYDRKGDLRQLYDTELMERGGHVTGYAVEQEEADWVTERLAQMEAEKDGIFLAVGDGNHSLAAAKTCWELAKKDLSQEAQQGHPLRYALVEVVNLHSPSMEFYPIHRVVYGAEGETLEQGFAAYLERFEMRLVSIEEDRAEITVRCRGEKGSFRIEGRGDHLPVELLQKYLDKALESQDAWRVDYVHSPLAAEEIARTGEGTAVLLRGMDKRELFGAVEAGGALPRKTFSIGEDIQKRYYIECRKLQM